MSDVDSSDLRLLRIDGDFRRSLPEDVRWAATLLMAYADGLTDGQRPNAAPPAPGSNQGPGNQGPRNQEPPGAAGRAQLEDQAVAAAAAVADHPGGDFGTANVCGVISGGPMPTSPAPDGFAPDGSAADGSGSGREVVLLWGPGAYGSVRRALS